MKVCSDCNRSNIDGTIFCLTCGSAKMVVLSDRFPWEDDPKEKSAPPSEDECRNEN